MRHREFGHHVLVVVEVIGELHRVPHRDEWLDFDKTWTNISMYFTPSSISLQQEVGFVRRMVNKRTLRGILCCPLKCWTPGSARVHPSHLQVGDLLSNDLHGVESCSE